MDLRSKLAFLKHPPSGAHGVPGRGSEDDSLDEPRVRDLPNPAASLPAPAPAPAASHPEPEDEAPARHRVLEELRRKMAEVLGRPMPERHLAEPCDSRLPFERREHARGVVYRRLERLPPSHHVGRIPVDSASTASAELIALLALDPSLSTVSFSRALFLDTETTGLGGGAGILPFLVGLSWFDAEGRLYMEQLLLRRPADEPALLECLRECFDRAEVIVTYNGKAFDLPLLASRYVMNRMPPLPTKPHLDLLHVARRLHRVRLGQCRLITLESAVLGFGRGPDVEGADVAGRYAHFLRTGDDAALEAVVGHNAWDVVSMAALVGLYGEPVDLLPSEDLVGLARTLRRAGALDQAATIAETAVARGGGASARRARGELAKARGDRARALLDFESLVDEVDDPVLRLELAKLYEHYVKAPALALEILERGTGEPEAALEKRRVRLRRKLEKPQRPKRARS